MPRGARPGERRGGRGPGSKNKFTRGREARDYYRTKTVDGTLRHLSDLLDAIVPKASDRKALGTAIDAYIAARERADARQRRTRSVVTGVPSEPMPQLLVPEIASLSMDEIATRFGFDLDALRAEADKQMAAEDAE